MLRVFSLVGDQLATFSAEEVEGKTVKSLKTLVGKQIGVTRFQQKWLAEDHSELHDDALVTALGDVQLVVLDFVQADEREVDEFLEASYKHSLDQVDELLRRPMNPNVHHSGLHSYRDRALNLAAQNGHVEVVKLLLEAGAEIDAANLGGSTALHLAAVNGCTGVVRLLLAAGADQNLTDQRGDRPMDFAIEQGHHEIAQLLESEHGPPKRQKV